QIEHGYLDVIYVTSMILMILTLFEQAIPMSNFAYYKADTDQALTDINEVFHSSTTTPKLTVQTKQEPVFSISNLNFKYFNQETLVLNDINLTIHKGEKVAIIGPSGSGKSTLLNLLGGMDRATSGTFIFDEELVTKFTDKELSAYRKDKIGFVFQFYNLVPSLTAKENIGIAANLVKNNKEIDMYLAQVGLLHRKNNFPNQLSGGEMQRVSIARALAKEPSLLLCDEPTGALDSKTGDSILTLLKEVSRNGNAAVVMVTHNREFAKFADRVIYLKDGSIEKIENNEEVLG
ncbi:MAG: ABC transporter ATP-binding protein, partial [Staphylococcus sp.]|nr:ABC transporter ATP-binding protein [Staphylococcus sp.]